MREGITHKPRLERFLEGSIISNNFGGNYIANYEFFGPPVLKRFSI